MAKIQKDLLGNNLVVKEDPVAKLFDDPRDNPENCPVCAHKLKFAHMVPAGFGPEHPVFCCAGCGKYFTNPFLDANAKLKPEHYAYFEGKQE